MPTPRHPVLLALALAAGLTLPGCVAKQPAEKKPGKNVRWSVRRAGDNGYVAARMKAKDDASSIAIVPRDLRPPFRCETRAGVFDDRRAEGVSEPTIFGMELDTPGGALPPPHFYFLSCQLSPGGLLVYSGSHLTLPNVAGQTFFANATQADLAIEHDGEDLLFFARAAGTSEWTPLGSVDPSGQPFPVHPTLGVFNGRRGGEVGFDGFRVIANAALGDPTPTQAVIEGLWTAIDLQNGAAHDLDEAVPDRPAAGAALAQAADLVDAAFDGLEALANPVKKTPEQLALKKLKSGRKQLASARGKLDKGKRTKAISKKLEKAVVLQFQAIHALQNPE